MTHACRTALVVLCCVFLADAADSPPPDTRGAAQSRPRVCLVLGGGGAKGMAHVGVLSVLEEQRVPVDAICGTSMGSIIGGLYAAGLSPQQIERLLVEEDWWALLRDRTDRDDTVFRRKAEDRRYLLDAEFGIRAWKLVGPSGFATGQKLHNVLEEYTRHASAVASFDDLGIPYRAVATDINSGEAVVLSDGNLATAMRASMAVPGVFTPVRLGGRTLVDGGLVNNVPVDVGKAMGADVIIAVDVLRGGLLVHSGAPGESLRGIIGQTYMIMTDKGQKAIVEEADLLITPLVVEQNPADFHKAADIITIGRDAAREAIPGLKPYTVDEATYREYLTRQRHPQVEPPVVMDVLVEGARRVDERAIRAQVRSRAGQPLKSGRVLDDVAQVYGLGDFENVSHTIEYQGTNECTLTYHVKEKSWGPGYLRFGARFESESDNRAYWYVLMNYTRTRLNARGGEWRTDLQVGQTRSLASDFYQPLDYAGSFFVNPKVHLLDDERDAYVEDEYAGTYGVDTALLHLDAGVALREYGEIRLGIVHGAARTDSRGVAGVTDDDDTVTGVTGSLVVDRLDRAVFMQQGYLVDVGGRVVRPELGGDAEYEKVTVELVGAIGSGDHTVIGRVEAGTSLDSDLPSYDEFRLGGADSFPGLPPGRYSGNHLLVGSVSYRYRFHRLPPGLGDGVYVVLRGDAGNTWQKRGEVDMDDLVFGGAAGLSADTAIGPVHLGVGWAESESLRTFMSLGTTF